MYQAYWQLTEKPFEVSWDPRFYYPSHSHQAALLKLRYALESGAEAALIAGPSGVGKSLVVSLLRGVVGGGFEPWVEVAFPRLPPEEYLAFLAEALGPKGSGQEVLPSHRQIEEIGRGVIEAAEQGRRPVVVVEDAHLITDPEWWETLRLLLNFRAGTRPGLTILLVTQPALLPLMERIPSWHDRLAVRALVRAFQPQETAAYVAHRLKVAGATREIFDPQAVELLHQLAQGIPRRINRLADLALLVGYAEGQDLVTADQLEAVAEELFSPLAAENSPLSTLV